MNALVTVAWRAALVAVDRFVAILPTRSGRGVLIVRLDALGDFVLWRRSAQAILDAFPGQRITLIANQNWADYAARSLPTVTVWSVDFRRFYRDLIYRCRILRRVRAAGFDVVIQPQWTRQYCFEEAFSYVAGAIQVIAWPEHLHGTVFGGRCPPVATCLVPSCDSTSELQRNVHFARAIADQFRVDGGNGILWPEERRRGRVPGYFVVVLGSGWSGRQWPASHFAEIVDRVWLRTGWSCVVCGGPGERELLRNFVTSAPVRDMVGRTTVAEYADLIAASQFVLANETSAIHLAAAHNVPSVCLTGGGHFGRFVPYPRELGFVHPPRVVNVAMPCYGCDWHCKFVVLRGAPVPCVATISVDECWVAVADVLEQAHAAQMGEQPSL